MDVPSSAPRSFGESPPTPSAPWLLLGLLLLLRLGLWGRLWGWLGVQWGGLPAKQLPPPMAAVTFAAGGRWGPKGIALAPCRVRCVDGLGPHLCEAPRARGGRMLLMLGPRGLAGQASFAPLCGLGLQHLGRQLLLQRCSCGAVPEPVFKHPTSKAHSQWSRLCTGHLLERHLRHCLEDRSARMW